MVSRDYALLEYIILYIGIKCFFLNCFVPVYDCTDHNGRPLIFPKLLLMCTKAQGSTGGQTCFPVFFLMHLSLKMIKTRRQEVLGLTATEPNPVSLKAFLMFARGLSLPTSHSGLALSHQLFETLDCSTTSRHAQALIKQQYLPDKEKKTDLSVFSSY